MLTIFNRFKEESEPILDELSRIRGTVVIPLLFHLQTSIAPWTVSRIYDRLVRFGEKIKGDVDVILFSRGGDPDTAYHIGRMLHRMVEGRLTFVIPRLASSAATLLSFSGDHIVMSPVSALTPIDPQIEIAPDRFVSARSLRESHDLIIREIMRPDIPKTTVEAFLEKLHLTEIVDYDLLLEHTLDLAATLLKLRMIKDERKAREIAERFVRGFKYHGRIITIDDAIEIGLKIEEMPQDVWRLVWEFHKRWEKIATTFVKEGSHIIDLDIGRGVAFIPVEEDEQKRS
jgi:hypothetical protein